MRMLDRLREFIENEGLSVSSFEKKICASDGVFRRALKKNTDVQSKWIYNISENFPKLNLEWLITGKGQMMKPPENNISPINLSYGFDSGNITIETNSIVNESQVEYGLISKDERTKQLEYKVVELETILKEKDECIKQLEYKVVELETTLKVKDEFIKMLMDPKHKGL